MSSFFNYKDESYINIIYNKNDSVSLERVINVPKRGIGPKAIDNIRNMSVINGCSMFDAIDSGKELEWKKLILELEEELPSEIITLVFNETTLTSSSKEFINLLTNMEL